METQITQTNENAKKAIETIRINLHFLKGKSLEAISQTLNKPIWSPKDKQTLRRIYLTDKKSNEPYSAYISDVPFTDVVLLVFEFNLDLIRANLFDKEYIKNKTASPYYFVAQKTYYIVSNLFETFYKQL